MRPACCAGSPPNTRWPRRWATRAAPRTACAAPWKSFSLASSARCARSMCGATDRSGPRAWTGRLARTPFPPRWIGTSGSDRRRGGLSSWNRPKAPLPRPRAKARAKAGAGGESISRSTGAGGRISAPAPSGTWPAIPSICLSARSSLATRWKSKLNARLDLHGLTQAQAHGALLRFMHNAHARDARLVLVITGKGRGAEPGVLRRQVPQWLGLPEFRAMVIGFEDAGARHGGEGALYVRLRRARG